MRLRQGNCLQAVGQVRNLPYTWQYDLLRVGQVTNLPYEYPLQIACLNLIALTLPVLS